MPLIPQDRRGQILLFATMAALAGGYFLWSEGIKPAQARAAATRGVIDSLTREVQAAKRDLARGTVDQLEQQLAGYEASLGLMRQLVPASGEVPNLLDDISSRAKIRGATVAQVVPAPPESGPVFDTQRYRMAVTGMYDQIGEFLSDIASLPRIIVPYGVHLERATGAAADTARSSLLQASFEIRTYVKGSRVSPVSTGG